MNTSPYCRTPFYASRPPADAATTAREYLAAYPYKYTGYSVVKVKELPWLYVWNERLHKWTPKNPPTPEKCDTDELPLSVNYIASLTA